MAIEPTPPVAPSTITGPLCGLSPVCSMRTMPMPAVKPAAPNPPPPPHPTPLASLVSRSAAPPAHPPSPPPGATAAAVGPRGLECVGLRSGRLDALARFCVEHIDEPGEPRSGVGIARGHFRHARQDHAGEAPGEVDKVGIGAGPAAQHREIEPH